MSPKILKRSRLSSEAVRFESKTDKDKKDASTKDLALQQEEWVAETRAQLNTEMAAALAAEKERLAALWQTELDQFYARSEPEMVRLILSIAARVCRQELTINREGVLSWVREGLSVLGGDGPRTVRVHKDDVVAVRALSQSVRSGVKIQGDPSLAPGDVLVEGEREQFDARVATRLEEVERSFQRLAEEEP